MRGTLCPRGREPGVRMGLCTHTLFVMGDSQQPEGRSGPAAQGQVPGHRDARTDPHSGLYRQQNMSQPCEGVSSDDAL